MLLPEKDFSPISLNLDNKKNRFTRGFFCCLCKLHEKHNVYLACVAFLDFAKHKGLYSFLVINKG